MRRSNPRVLEGIAMRRISTLFATGFAILVASGIAAQSQSEVRIYLVKDNFASVQQDVIDAIIKHGLVVDYTAHIGAMLARTAKDVGASKTIYSDAETVQFCSATLSRRAMEADPTNIAFCPYVIFLYALPGSPGITNVGFRPLPRAGSKESRAAIDAVNALLDDIVRAAAGKK
jgi:hypothetical protein